MLRRLLLLLVLLVPSAARAERVYVWIENANIGSVASYVHSTIVPWTNNTYRYLTFASSGGGSDQILRRARIPIIIPSDWGNTFDARVQYTVGGHCTTASEHCWYSGAGGGGCPAGTCVSEASGGTCAWNIYLDAYPNVGDLTAGPTVSGEVTDTPASSPLGLQGTTNVVSGVAISDQSAAGAPCSGTNCRGAYGLLTIELNTDDSTYEFCDVREIELRGN